MDTRTNSLIILFDEEDAAAHSGSIDVNYTEHIGFSLVIADNAGTASVVVKVKASFEDYDVVDFTKPSTKDNPWFYAQFTSAEDQISGVYHDDGTTLAAGTYGFNVDNFNYASIAVELSTVTDASVSGKLRKATNA